jgi:hypothetical protein
MSSLLVCYVLFSHTSLHGPYRSINLGSLPLSGLHEHGQQNDPAFWSDPVRHPDRPVLQEEAQLA